MLGFCQVPVTFAILPAISYKSYFNGTVLKATRIGIFENVFFNFFYRPRKLNGSSSFTGKPDFGIRIRNGILV